MRCERAAAVAVAVSVWCLPVEGAAAPAAVIGEKPVSEAPVEALEPAVPGVAIWVEPTVPEGERIREWVEERARQVLDGRERALEAADLIRVAVRGGPYDYQVHIALVRNKRLIEEQLEVLACECGSDEMLEKVGEAISTGADRLAKVAEAERAERNQAWLAAEERGDIEQLSAAHRTKEDHRQPLGGMGYAGIGVGALGAGLLAAGIPLAVRPDGPRGDGGSLMEYTTRPPGITLAVAGSVALATGTSLIVVDVLRRRKRGVAIAPAVGASQVGVRVVGRF